MKKIVTTDDYDIVILDEIFIALYYNLISSDDIKKMIKSKSHKIELILTGRYAPEDLFQYADLITEMKEIKHYYNTGVEARAGIEF